MIYIVSYKERHDDIWSDVSWSSQNLALFLLCRIVKFWICCFYYKTGGVKCLVY